MAGRTWLTGIVLCMLAVSASAEIKHYTLRGDSSTLFPTDGTIVRPATVSGNAVIDDSGNDAPTLEAFELVVDWTLIVGTTTTSGIPGTTGFLRSVHELTPAPGQPGTGDTETTIAWGTLTGWSQTGFLVCRTFCPGGCPTGVSLCLPFVGFEGLGPNAPLSASSYDTGPWEFSPDGLAFEATSLEFVNLSGGVVRFSALWEGALTQVPIVPGLGIGALGFGMAVWGMTRLRRASGKL